MVSGQLEDSLRHEIESYIEGRLGGVKQEIAALQSQLNEALSQLMDRQSEVQLDGSVAASILDHLRAAHDEGIDLAASESSRAKASSDMAIVKAAISEIDEQQSQSDILKILVNRASAFAPRVAFFVIKGEQSIGWRARGFQGTVGDNVIHEISFAASADTAIGNAARSRKTWSGGPGSHSEDYLILNRLGDDPPARIVAVPLVVRDRAVAVLYADSAELDSDAINLEAVETLVRVAGMAVELLAARSAPAKQPVAHEPAEEAPAAEASVAAAVEAPVVTPEITPVEATREYQPPVYVPVAEYGETTPVVAESAAAQPAPAEEAREYEPPAYAPATEHDEITPVVEESAPAQEAPVERAPTHEPPAYAPATEYEPSAYASVAEYDEITPVIEESAPAPEAIAVEPELEAEAPPEAEPETEQVPALYQSPVETAPEAPAESPLTVAALPEQPATAEAPATVATPAPRRRYGADVELPIEVTNEEERRLHSDARRFARLLVSEVKLYNEQKVTEGRSQNDLYQRLREDIDRSRQMYDKRVKPEVAQRYDYFHHELVNTLAEGDAAKLGSGYPGATVLA